MGYDTDLDRAYDQQRLGWKYETVKCEHRPGGILRLPYLNCDPNDEEKDPLFEQVMPFAFPSDPQLEHPQSAHADP